MHEPQEKCYTFLIYFPPCVDEKAKFTEWYHDIYDINDFNKCYLLYLVATLWHSNFLAAIDAEDAMSLKLSHLTMQVGLGVSMFVQFTTPSFPFPQALRK